MFTSYVMLLLHAVNFAQLAHSEYVSFDWRRPNDVRRFCISYEKTPQLSYLSAVIHIHSNLEEEFCCSLLTFSFSEGRLQAKIGREQFCLEPQSNLEAGVTLVLIPEKRCHSSYEYQNLGLISKDNSTLCVGTLADTLQLVKCADKEEEDDWLLIQVNCQEESEREKALENSSLATEVKNRTIIEDTEASPENLSTAEEMKMAGVSRINSMLSTGRRHTTLQDNCSSTILTRSKYISSSDELQPYQSLSSFHYETTFLSKADKIQPTPSRRQNLTRTDFQTIAKKQNELT